MTSGVVPKRAVTGGAPRMTSGVVPNDVVIGALHS
jgi:hypothetical protein